ncbi:MAG TPA: ATP-dependent DNA ligase [Candidatus Angelobacter sp.]|nr:ATP-dependent DNA ligase [Candidatus Angelobacter sp.]
MQEFAATCEAVAATTKKTEKVRLVAEYFLLRPSEAAQAAVFLSGRVFPAWEERTLQVGGRLLWRAVAELSSKGDVALTAAYRRHGDLGAAAQDVLAEIAPHKNSLSVSEVAGVFEQLACTSNTARKLAMLKELLRRATALEAKYILKIIGGDLRIGLRESLVEEAIATAFDCGLAEVQRANMLLGDIGETLRLATEDQLEQARMRLFHPIGFMLASPAADAKEAFAYFQEAVVEDKYDGIRAQAHCGGKDNPQARIFSRTLDEISESFPELPPALLAFRDPVILDGEILAWKSDMQNGQAAGRALPFSELQKRLGRKKVSSEMVRLVPTAYVVFDVLYASWELLIERPLHERKKILEQLFASVPKGGFNTGHIITPQTAQGSLVFEPAITSRSGPPRVIQSPVARADSAEHLEKIFEESRERGNEGLMVKDIHSPYLPGRRGKSWLKLKRELATLDVVVTAVEWGHGKRIKVLSDYTFAVRAGEQLLNVGKAYSGLTDAEIAEMTQWFLQHTIEDQGFRRVVEPQIVLEVAFNNVTKSDRHASGFAMRFPRIVRIRTDKRADDIDTLETVREIYERQHQKPTADPRHAATGDK